MSFYSASQVLNKLSPIYDMAKDDPSEHVWDPNNAEYPAGLALQGQWLDEASLFDHGQR